MRIIEERQDLGDGWHTEWEPSPPPRDAFCWTDADWRREVRRRNVDAKSHGENIQYRSREQDE